MNAIFKALLEAVILVAEPLGFEITGITSDVYESLGKMTVKFDLKKKQEAK